MQVSKGALGQKGTFVRVSDNIFETNFEPDSLTDVWFWFDGNDVTTVFQDLAGTIPANSNGDVVALWKDKSVNGLDVSQATASKRPVMAFGAFNGNNVLDFDNTDWFERILGANYTGDFTLFIVLKSQLAPPNNYDSFYASHNSPGTTGAFQIDYNSGTANFQVRSRFGGSNIFTVFDVFTTNVIKLFSITYDATTNVLTTYDNGTFKDSDVNTDIFHSRIRINSNRNADRFHDGQTAEVIAYRKILDACQNGKVIGYLNKKYATTFANKPTPGGIGCDGSIIWLRADTGTSTTTDGVNVSQWDNLSFLTGVDATQAVAGNQPVFRDNATDNINFNPVIDFSSASSHYLRIPYNSFLNNDSLTVFSIHKVRTGSSSYRTPYASRSSAAFTGYNLYASNTDSYEVWTGNGAGFVAETGSGITYVPEITSLELTAGVGNADIVLERNGTVDISTAAGTYVQNTTIDYQIGSNDNGTAWFWDGSVAEQIMYSKILSQNKKDIIESYLAIKYGITISHDYIATKGTIVYDVSNGYANGILGVAREISGFFYQKKSRSESDVADGLTIELTTEISSGVYVICGHDGGGMARVSLAGEANALTQKWYSDHTGGVGTLNLELDLAEMGLGTTPAASDVKILIANNPAFNNTHKIEATSVVAGIAYFSGIPLYDKYFTFSIP